MKGQACDRRRGRRRRKPRSTIIAPVSATVEWVDPAVGSSADLAVTVSGAGANGRVDGAFVGAAAIAGTVVVVVVDAGAAAGAGVVVEDAAVH